LGLNVIDTKNKNRYVLLPLLTLLAFFSTSLMTLQMTWGQFAVQQALEPGDKAPELEVSDWITDGNGKFSKVTEFEKGQVYVVEFWATWCGPCIAMMPEMARLQENYGDKVRFLSITEETPDEVIMLKERDFPNKPGVTFKAYMNEYTVAADPDGSTHTAFLGTGSTGIPHSFIVGETGEIEWSGHPASLDPILTKIVGGSWDREKYYADQKEIASLDERIGQALQVDDFASAFDLAGELPPLYEQEDQLALRFKRAMLAMRLPGEDGREFLKETLKVFSKEEGAVAALVWKVVQLKNSRVEVSEDILADALAAMEAQVKGMSTETDDQKMIKGATIDIMAHLLFVMKRLDDALIAQEEAVKLLDEKEITDFLAFLKTRKAELALQQEDSENEVPEQEDSKSGS
jgi:thiol-disulfide isomerase/thioredoxin